MKLFKMTTGLLACTCLLLPAWAQADLAEEFAVEAGGTLSIRADAGSIDVSTSNQSLVGVEIEFDGLDEDDFAITMEKLGNDVDISVRRKRSFFRWFDWGRQSVRFTAIVPEHYNLDLETAGGSVSAHELEGSVLVKTSGGRLEFSDIVGPLNATTSGGTITLQRITGNVDVQTSGGRLNFDDIEGDVLARTSGGSIYVGNVSGRLELSTSGGSMDLEGLHGPVAAKTSGGSIRADFVSPLLEPASLSSSGGSITVSIPSDSNLDLNARGNRVRSDFPVGGETSRRGSLAGAINAGGPELSLRTSGGSVNIRRL